MEGWTAHRDNEQVLVCEQCHESCFEDGRNATSVTLFTSRDYTCVFILRKYASEHDFFFQILTDKLKLLVVLLLNYLICI
jgi:hypothetical protein